MTTSHVPVIYEAASDARKTAAVFMSVLVPYRWSGIHPVNEAISFGSLFPLNLSAPSVPSIGPGAIATTLTF